MLKHPTLLTGPFRSVSIALHNAANGVSALLRPKASATPLFLYIPWIKHRTDYTFALLKHDARIQLREFDLIRLVSGQSGEQHRGQVLGADPAGLKQIIRVALAENRHSFDGMLLTMDWCRGMREVAEVCREEQIPSLMIPHESVFADEETFYDGKTPLADEILCWGGLQRDIFCRRGYNPAKVRVVGSPKFDVYFKYRPAESRSHFYRRYGLAADRKTILFAAQPCDLQFDERKALAAQAQAVVDCWKYARKGGHQLLIRLPPGRNRNILGSDIVADGDTLQIDGDGGVFEAPSIDSIFHADTVVSFNSTMLFEAALLDTPSISVGYIPFNFFWHVKAGIPLAQTREALFAALDESLRSRTHAMSAEGERWARWAFSPGSFDGLASERIISHLLHRFGGRRPQHQPA